MKYVNRAKLRRLGHKWTWGIISFWGESETIPFYYDKIVFREIIIECVNCRCILLKINNNKFQIDQCPTYGYPEKLKKLTCQQVLKYHDDISNMKDIMT